MALMLAPVEKLARGLNDIPSQITRVVSAVAQQK
jgi:large subunit ribosomal protein L10